jgi:hypothetical protein
MEPAVGQLKKRIQSECPIRSEETRKEMALNNDASQ